MVESADINAINSEWHVLQQEYHTLEVCIKARLRWSLTIASYRKLTNRTTIVSMNSQNSRISVSKK